MGCFYIVLPSLPSQSCCLEFDSCSLDTSPNWSDLMSKWWQANWDTVRDLPLHPAIFHADNHFSFPEETVSFLADRSGLLHCSCICFYFWEVQEIEMWNEWPSSFFTLKKNEIDKLVSLSELVQHFLFFLLWSRKFFFHCAIFEMGKCSTKSIHDILANTGCQFATLAFLILSIKNSCKNEEKYI